MSYSDIIKIRAYTLFIQGTSYEETARKISEEFGKKISAGTIRKWAEAKDAKGSSWREYRSETRVVAQRTIESKEKNRLVKIRDKVETIVERLYDNLTDTTVPKVSSYDGGSYALKAMADFLLKLDDKAGKQVDAIVVCQTVIEIFGSIPSIREAIEAHWQELEKEIRIRILHENPNTAQDVKQIEQI